jgi:ribose transport system ATP-binding protein
VLEHLSKTFPGQMALVDVDLEVRPGEVHALLGQNGSGKSTLIKILAGFHQPDSGARATYAGEPIELGSATAAQEAGIRFVHQDLALVEDLDAVDNLALGSGGYAGRWWLSSRRERRAASGALAQLGLGIDLNLPLRKLSAAERTMVAIARAMREGSESRRLLVLDEPTAALGGERAERLFDLVRRIRAGGGSVLYVTHRLEEVFELADRVTVLRDGRRVDTRVVSELDHDGLVELIVGRALSEIFPTPQPARADVLLGASGLAGEVIRDVSFDVHAGEIVGVTGLFGSGREELPYLLTGARPLRGGSLALGGDMLGRLTSARAIEAGIAFVPADRKRESALPLMSVAENVTLPRLVTDRRTRWLSVRRERADALSWLRRVDVRPLAPEATLATLSGGNQQKAVIARWLRRRSRVLVMDEPTQGVDIGAKAGIYRDLAAVAEEGGAVIVFSSDTEELASLCDRVLVIRSGQVAHVVDGETLEPGLLGELMLRRQGVPA